MIKRFSPTAIGRWSTRRPVLAIAAWLTFVVAAVVALSLTGSKPLDNGAVGESARGYALMDSHRLGLPPQEYVYLHSDSLKAGSPAFRTAIGAVDRAMRARDRERRERGGIARPALGARERDGHAGRSTRPPSTPRSRSVGTAHPGVSAIVADPTSGGGNDLHRAEELSIPVTLLVLLISFGALVAALVPVALAATAVIAAFGLLGPISQLFPLDDSVKTVVLLIGMAVGVDYALFYVVRSREERLRGASTREALERTSRTSGRSVLIAGTTVAIAMAGQFVVGSDIFNGIAAGTIVVVACAVAGSVTVLPALLQLLGPRIDRGRIPFLPQLATAGESRFWAGVVDRVMRRPVLAACLSGGLLVALAVPAFGLQVAKPSSQALSSASQSDLAAQITGEFPSTSSPAVVVATWPSGETAAVRQAVGRLEAARDGARHRSPTVLDRARPRRPLSSAGPAADRVRRQHREPQRGPRAARCAGAGHARAGTRRAHGGDRRHRGGHRLHQPDATRGPVRGRIRAGARVRAAARRIPIDRGADQGDRAQPAVGRRFLRRARTRVPAPLGAGRARLSL